MVCSKRWCAGCAPGSLDERVIKKRHYAWQRARNQIGRKVWGGKLVPHLVGR